MFVKKRVTLLCGHYGSGKTNIAVNLALKWAGEGEKVTIADLDIVNPYFRTKDSARELEMAGVKLIVSPYANTNVDVPALPQELNAVTEDRSRLAILDVGGDDRGALALGRWAPAIREENDYDMLFVFNASRPLTRTPQAAIEILREIEEAGGIPFTGIVNNTHLGSETTPEMVLQSVEAAGELSRLTRLPLRFTAVRKDLAGSLRGKVEPLLEMELQSKLWSSFDRNF